MKAEDRLWAACFVVIVGGALCWLFGGLDGALNVLTALGTVGAVVVALFYDQIKTQMHPYDAELLIVRPEGTCEPNGDYVWHLRVLNKSKDRPLHGCTVFVTGSTENDAKESWPTPHEFAVERALEWAPTESREYGVTIWTQRTLELGRIFNDIRFPERGTGFILSLYDSPSQTEMQDRLTSNNLWVGSGERIIFSLEIRAQDFVRTYNLEIYWSGVRLLGSLDRPELYTAARFPDLKGRPPFEIKLTPARALGA